MANEQWVSGVIIRQLEGQDASKNIRKYLFWRRFKVKISQISKEERVFVAENVFERKTYITALAVFRKQFNQATPYKKENPTKL